MLHEMAPAQGDVAVVAANQDAWYVAHLIDLIAVVLFLPVILGLMHMMREREVALAHIGGGLALVGLMATMAVVSIEGLVGWQAGAQNSPEMTALFERLTETTGIVVPVFLMSFALSLGVIVMIALLCMSLMQFMSPALPCERLPRYFVGSVCMMRCASGSRAATGVVRSASAPRMMRYLTFVIVYSCKV